MRCFLFFLLLLCSVQGMALAQSENPFGPEADLEVQPSEAMEDSDEEVEDQLGTSQVAVPLLNFEESHLDVSKPSRIHGRKIEPTKDRAPEGGVLVGMRFTRNGTRWHDRVVSLQPIYQVGKDYKRGKVFGRRGSYATKLMAEPGMIVGGVRLDLFGGEIKGAQLIYYHFNGKEVTVTSRQASETVGDEMHRADIELDLAKPIVGMHGYVEAFDEEFEDEEFHDPRFTQPDIESLVFEFVDLERLRLDTEKPSPLPLLESPAKLMDHELALADRPSTTSTYYDDMAPDGGMLVGFRVYNAISHGRMRTRSAKLQPLYQQDDRYVAGQDVDYGQDVQFQTELIRAKPGYAVCGVAFEHNALCQVLFAKVDGQKLDMSDRYVSPRLFEPRDKSKLKAWKSPSLPVIGLKVRQSLYIEAMSLVTADDGSGGATSLPKLNYQGIPIGIRPIVRVWTSDRGKKVEATLMRFDAADAEVTIKKEGGREFRLPLAKYSKEDQEFLRSLETLPKG